MTSRPAAGSVWHGRASHAARSVTALFGRKLLFLPGTHLAAVAWNPGEPVQSGPAWRQKSRSVSL